MFVTFFIRKGSMLFHLILLSCTNSNTPVSKPIETSQESSSPISLPLPQNGYQLTTPVYEVPPYTEIELCTIMKLEPKDTEKLFWVNKMESLVTEHTHHMNVFMGEFSFLDAFMGEGASENALGFEVGQYPCEEIGLMESAYTLFPSQRQNQKITLPDGVAAPLTAPLLLIFSHHFINTTDSPIPIEAVLNIETIASEEVTDVAGLIFNDIHELEIPPHTRQTVERTCIVERDVEVALVSSHNHQWGQCATMNKYDGNSQLISDESFFVNKLWDRPPILHFEPGSFSLSAGDGIHWACHYENNTDNTLINDGTAEGEMCILAAVTYPSTWTVSEVEEAVLGDDITSLFTLLHDVMGPCDTVVENQRTLTNDMVDYSCDELPQTESNVLE